MSAPLFCSVVSQPSPASAGSTTLPANSTDSAKLGWILIRRRWISAAQLQEALSQQVRAPQTQLGELLLQQALISEPQLQQALREQYWRRNGYWVI